MSASGSGAVLIPRDPINVSQADRFAGFSTVATGSGMTNPGTIGSGCRSTMSASGSRFGATSFRDESEAFSAGASFSAEFSVSGFFFGVSFATGSAGPGVPRILARSFQ